MQWISTGLSLVAAGVAIFFAYGAWQHRLGAADYERDCARNASKLNALAGQVISTEGALNRLVDRFRKLEGRFYALIGELDIQNQPQDRAGAPGVGPNTPAPEACENWERARREGPDSMAAKCPCVYCDQMREQRAHARRELMPRARAATLAEARK